MKKILILLLMCFFFPVSKAFALEEDEILKHKKNLIVPKYVIYKNKYELRENLKGIKENIIYLNDIDSLCLKNYISCSDYLKRSPKNLVKTTVEEIKNAENEVISLRVLIQNELIKDIELLVLEDVYPKILGPSVFTMKYKRENGFDLFLKNYKISQEESDVEPFKLRVFLISNGDEIEVDNFYKFPPGTYKLLLKKHTLSSKLLTKTATLNILKTTQEITNINNKFEIDLKDKRPYEEYIIKEYEKYLKSINVQASNIYINKSTYRQLDTSNSQDTIYVLYSDKKNNTYSDYITVNKDKIKEDKETLKPVYIITIILFSFASLFTVIYFIKKIVKKKQKLDKKM